MLLVAEKLLADGTKLPLALAVVLHRAQSSSELLLELRKGVQASRFVAWCASQSKMARCVVLRGYVYFSKRFTVDKKQTRASRNVRCLHPDRLPNYGSWTTPSLCAGHRSYVRFSSNRELRDRSCGARIFLPHSGQPLE